MNCHYRRRTVTLMSCYIISVGLILLVFLTGAYAGDKSYRIMITNDDGIDAKGIHVLARELKKLGEVLVVAPNENKSASSQSFRVDGGELIRVQPYYRDGKLFGYGVNGSPALAVAVGILEISKNKKIDIVVSGVNNGANVGSTSHHSGTVGAAMEALHNGVPAVAVSLSYNDGDYLSAARFAARVVEKIKKRGALPGVVLSINYPSGKVKGMVIAPMGGTHYKASGFKKIGGNTYEPIRKNIVGRKGTDTGAYLKNYITITPLRFDWSDKSAVEILKTWNIGW